MFGCFSMMSVNCTLDILVIPVNFDVNSRTGSNTGSPGRSVFDNCLPVQWVDMPYSFRSPLTASLYLNLILPKLSEEVTRHTLYVSTLSKKPIDIYAKLYRIK